MQSTVKSFSLPTKKVSSGPNPSISTFDASPLGLTWTLNGLFGTLLPPYLTSTLWRPGRSGTYSTEYVPSPLSLTSTSRSGPVGGATEAEMRSKGESLVKKAIGYFGSNGVSAIWDEIILDHPFTKNGGFLLFVGL